MLQKVGKREFLQCQFWSAGWRLKPASRLPILENKSPPKLALLNCCLAVHSRGTSSLAQTLTHLKKLIGAMSVASAVAVQGFSREFAKAIDDLAETSQFQKVQELFGREFRAIFGPISERAITWTLTEAFKFCYNWIQQSETLLQNGFKFCAIIHIICLFQFQRLLLLVEACIFKIDTWHNLVQSCPGIHHTPCTTEAFIGGISLFPAFHKKIDAIAWDIDKSIKESQEGKSQKEP